ncbi:hypothetical protein JHI67_001218 [Escherichia coli]|nr:hypothetical protein [Escherichia coli]
MLRRCNLSHGNRYVYRAAHQLCANVQGNLMDEMLITIIQGHAQRLGMKTIAGPVVLPLVMDTLSGIGVDLIYGEVIADAQPLDLLVNSSYFAIN